MCITAFIDTCAPLLKAAPYAMKIHRAFDRYLRSRRFCQRPCICSQRV